MSIITCIVIGTCARTPHVGHYLNSVLLYISHSVYLDGQSSGYITTK